MGARRPRRYAHGITIDHEWGMTGERRRVRYRHNMHGLEDAERLEYFASRGPNPY